jgi:hypothetical protein
MSFTDPSFPTSETPQPPRARRRRRGQLNIPGDAQGRTALLMTLARRAYPTYEIFVYALLCGAILGLGFLLDSQALLLFGILMAPLLMPWIGVLLAAITGSTRFFFETLMALLISVGLVFVIGALSGFAARAFLPRTFNEAFVHSRLWWPDLAIVAVGAIILTVSFVRTEEKPFLPSVMLAYGLFLPISAAGFGLGSGVGDIWPNGAFIFLVHFAWAGMFGLITLIALRFMPTSIEGFVLSAGIAVVFVILLLHFMSGAALKQVSTSQMADPTQPPTLTVNILPVSQAGAQPSPSFTPIIETTTPTQELSLSPTPVPLTLEVTLPPSETPTVTLTIEPTPIYARILADKGGGAYLRKSPNGKYLITLDNYSVVQVLPDTQEINGVTWAHVIAIKNGLQLEGWILQIVLDVATPAPNWQPSATPVFTSTP